MKLSKILEQLDDHQRKDMDEKVEALHQNWNDTKNVVENRVDLSSSFLQFLQLAGRLSEMFDCVEEVLRNSPEESKLAQLDGLWEKIKPAYGQLKDDGQKFIVDAPKVSMIDLLRLATSDMSRKQATFLLAIVSLWRPQNKQNLLHLTRNEPKRVILGLEHA